MAPVKLPKEVLNLFPTWEYRCPCCGAYVESNKSFCPTCKTPFDEKRWRVPPRFLKSHDAMSKYAHKVLAPKLTPKQRERLFQYFTELFSDGFESGDFSQWTATGGNPTIEGSPVHCGSYSAEFTPSDGGEYARKTLGSTYSTLYARCYVRVATVGSYNRGYLGIHDEYGNLIGGIGADSTRHWQLRYRDGGGQSEDTSSTQFSLNTWYCIELRVYQDNANGEFQVWVDGVELTDLAKTGIDNYIATNLQQVRVGYFYGSSGAENNIDCVVVADTYIGPETTEQTYTKTWTTDALFKKLAIPKTLGVDAAFQKSFIIQNQMDALFKRFDILKSFAVDARFGALITQIISRQIDVLLKKLDATATFGLDVYFGPVEAEAYAKNFALDTIFAYKVRLPELWLDENGKIVLNISEPYTWVGS